MRRVANGIITIVAVITLAAAGYAQDRACTDAEGRRALDEAVMLRNWDALYRSYKAYRHCDDGAIGEGYSESVARTLVDHWNTLGELDRLAKKDTQFRHFVIRHLDSTLDLNDVETVKKNAQAQCPMALRSLCRDLSRQADAALKEADSSQ